MIVIQDVKFTLQSMGSWSILEVIVNPPLEVPFLDMDEFIKFYLANIQTKDNMKLQ